MMEDSITHHLALAGIITYLIQFLKRSNFPWVTENSDRINKTISILAAFISSIGVQAAITGTVDTGWHITASTPSGWAMMETIMHTMGQWVIQQSVYHGIVKKGATS